MPLYKLSIVALLFPLSLAAQETADTTGISVTGSIESNIRIPQYDEKIGTDRYDDWAMTNTYANIDVESRYFDAGARLEFLKHPLPGYDEEIRGWGVPYYYIKGKIKNAELTLGTFYEQFGSGLVFRTYEERTLGIDNSILGARLRLCPINGMNIKALIGKQRRYWGHTNALVTATDAEYNIPLAKDTAKTISIGASYVNIHHPSSESVVVAEPSPDEGQPSESIRTPRSVNLFAVRAALKLSPFTLSSEFAFKGSDPSKENGYSTSRGRAFILTAQYDRNNLGILLRAKRSNNMSTRTERTQTSLTARIDFQPSFIELHDDYDLPTTYPAVQPANEQSFQARITYRMAEGTALGGKYGTDLMLNFSHISARHNHKSSTYYQDISAVIDRRINEALSLKLIYINQVYNAMVHDEDDENIRSNIFIADASYDINERMSLNVVGEYLTTKYDQGDWLFGKIALSIDPHWTFSVSDEWNCGETKTHYWYGEVGFATGNHELSVGYGRVSETYLCVDGLCRYEPTAKGLFVSYNYSF